jgi:plasmid stabilization system protein ParE
MKLIVSEAALADLERLHAFLADKNPPAAKRAVTVLVAAVESLNHFPERGRPAGRPDTPRVDRSVRSIQLCSSVRIPARPRRGRHLPHLASPRTARMSAWSERRPD